MSLIVGLLCTFFVIQDDIGLIERIGFGLIFAIILQTFNIVILWSMFDYLYLSFLWSLITLAFVESIFLVILLRNYKFKFIIDRKSSFILPIIFLLALYSRLWFQCFNFNQFTPDGAYYSDIARNLVEKGIFCSNRLDVDPARTYHDQNGFFANTFVPFAFAFFLGIMGSNFSSIKIALVIIGSSIIIPIYFIGKELFNEKVGLIAAFIASIYPTLLFYSSIPFGQEAVSNFFFFSFYALFVKAFKSSGISSRQIAFTSLILFLSRGAWKYSADFFLFTLPFLLFIITRKLKIFIYGLLLSFTLLSCLYSSILPTVWIPLITSVLVMTIMGFRSNDVDIKKLSWFFIFLVLFVNLGVLRAYRHSEILSYAPSPTSRISSAIDVASSINVLERLHAWFDGVNNLNHYLFILSLVGLMFKGKIRNIIFITVYPLAYSIMFILFYPFAEFEERFLIHVFLLLIIPCSYTLEKFYYNVKELIEHSTVVVRVRLPDNHIVILNLRKSLALFVSLLFLLTFFYPYIPYGYSIYLKKMQSIDPVNHLYMAQTINWMKNNASNDDIFLNPNPTYYAWLADKKVGIIRNTNISEIYEIISRLDVDYIIIDPAASYYLPQLMIYIKSNWMQPLPGFNAVFYQQYSSPIPEVIVYDVRDLQKLKLVFKHLLVNPCENMQGFAVSTNYNAENLSLQLNDQCVEEEASIMAKAQTVPKDSDLVVIYEIGKEIDVNKISEINLWMKTSGLLNSSNVWLVEVRIIGSDEKFIGWRFNQWNDKTWQLIRLKIVDFSIMHPSGPPRSFNRIVIRVSNRDWEVKPLTLWIDSIEIVGIFTQ
ncbi:MAG: glycosyltransferase family 39 protein [Nitrososphaerota archaeon]